MHRQADAVKTRLRQQVHVLTIHVILKPELVELVAIRLANEINNARFDGMLRAFVADAEHVTFLQHPAAKAHPAENNFLALAIHDPRIPGPEKSGGLSLKEAYGSEHRAQERRPFHSSLSVCSSLTSGFIWYNMWMRTLLLLTRDQAAR